MRKSPNVKSKLQIYKINCYFLLFPALNLHFIDFFLLSWFHTSNMVYVVNDKWWNRHILYFTQLITSSNIYFVLRITHLFHNNHRFCVWASMKLVDVAITDDCCCRYLLELLDVGTTPKYILFSRHWSIKIHE